METNLHTVAISASILAVRCSNCWHRATLGKDRLPIYRGNMTPVSSLELRCQVCRATDGFTLYIPFNEAEADAFRRGDDLEHRRV